MQSKQTCYVVNDFMHELQICSPSVNSLKATPLHVCSSSFRKKRHTHIMVNYLNLSLEAKNADLLEGIVASKIKQYFNDITMHFIHAYSTTFIQVQDIFSWLLFFLNPSSVC